MPWKLGTGDPYVLLEELWVERGECGPLPAIERTERGKPFFSTRGDVFFNLSHSGELVLCAMEDRPVGVDLERVRPRGGRFPHHVLSEREWKWFVERGSRWEDFYTLWTLKEARVKCTGEGIFRVSVRQVEVPLLTVGETARWEGFCFFALGGDGWRGAVCQKEL